MLTPLASLLRAQDVLQAAAAAYAAALVDHAQAAAQGEVPRPIMHALLARHEDLRRAAQALAELP